MIDDASPLLAPAEIERRSMAIIAAELGETGLAPEVEAVVKRVIHATADFDYFRTLRITPADVEAGIAALAMGAPIVTDTQMAWAGINKMAASRLGCGVFCHIADADVAEAALETGGTRSRAAVDKAAALYPAGIYVVGNAPTALIRICELVESGRLNPALVVGTPVGFVQVEESKELLLDLPAPSIVAHGRKGGSPVAAAIMNALLYRAVEQLDVG